jgi:hypothetical protein
MPCYSNNSLLNEVFQHIQKVIYELENVFRLNFQIQIPYLVECFLYEKLKKIILYLTIYQIQKVKFKVEKDNV